MAVKKKSKKTVSKKTKKATKHSPNLNLTGPEHSEIKNARILKNILPPENRWGGGKWDHLIVKLQDGDCVELETKAANSFASRARHLGYVVVTAKHNESITRAWFEGWDPNFKPKKRRAGGKV